MSLKNNVINNLDCEKTVSYFNNKNYMKQNWLVENGVKWCTTAKQVNHSVGHREDAEMYLFGSSYTLLTGTEQTVCT